jgi:hypothetical protein
VALAIKTAHLEAKLAKLKISTRDVLVLYAAQTARVKPLDLRIDRLV